MSITGTLIERPSGLCNHVESYGHCIIPAITYGYCKYHVHMYVPGNTKQPRLTKSCMWLTDGKACGSSTNGRFCEEHTKADAAKKQAKSKAVNQRTCGWLTDGKVCGVSTNSRFCEEHTKADAAKKQAKSKAANQRTCGWLTDGKACGVSTNSRFCDEHTKSIIAKKQVILKATTNDQMLNHIYDEHSRKEDTQAVVDKDINGQARKQSVAIKELFKVDWH